jgi:hypothetical protein
MLADTDKLGDVEFGGMKCRGTRPSFRRCCFGVCVEFNDVRVRKIGGDSIGHSNASLAEMTGWICAEHSA